MMNSDKQAAWLMRAAALVAAGGGAGVLWALAAVLL
jgi:hypothetical protein